MSFPMVEPRIYWSPNLLKDQSLNALQEKEANLRASVYRIKARKEGGRREEEEGRKKRMCS